MLTLRCREDATCLLLFFPSHSFFSLAHSHSIAMQLLSLSSLLLSETQRSDVEETVLPSGCCWPGLPSLRSRVSDPVIHPMEGLMSMGMSAARASCQLQPRATRVRSARCIRVSQTFLSLTRLYFFLCVCVCVLSLQVLWVHRCISVSLLGKLKLAPDALATSMTSGCN